MTENEHVYTICHSLEVAGDVVSGGNVRTIEGYAALNFEVSEFSSFRYIPKEIISAEAAADIDDSITRKRIRVSLNQVT